ncbi:MAG: NAD(P)-binding domain-containing protein, partial [Acidimicrobiales bacterium]
MRVAVFGAGAVGARVARQLASTEEIGAVLVHDRRPDRVREVVAAVGSPAAPFEGIGDGLDGAVLALPAGAHAERAAELVGAGVPVISIADGIADVAALLELDAEARARQVPVIVGAGFSPGLTCLLARHAAGRFDTVDEIHVAKAGTGGPACAHQHHSALAGTAVDWRDGGWVRRRGGSGRELVWFPDPVGPRDCYRAGLPDALLLVPAFAGVERVTARMAANRRDRITAHLPMLRRPHAEGGPGAVRVEVRGRQGGT